MPVPGSLPVRLAPALDGASLVFAVGLATTCGVAFGLAPALQLARADVVQALRGGRGSVGGRNRLRTALVGIEIAVALVVLTLAGLFLKSFRNALSVSPGFDSARVMLASIDLGGRGYNKQTGGALLDDLLQRLNETPGVERAAAGNYVPLDLRGIPTGVISIEGKEPDPSRKIYYYYTTADYFATMASRSSPARISRRALAPIAARRRDRRGDGPPLLARRKSRRPPLRSQRRHLCDRGHRAHAEAGKDERVAPARRVAADAHTVCLQPRDPRPHDARRSPRLVPAIRNAVRGSIRNSRCSTRAHCSSISRTISSSSACPRRC